MARARSCSSGSVLLGLGLVLASRATSLLEFTLVYGLLVGFAAGSFMPPLIAVVTNWFDRQRALAVSLVSCGLGVAPMTVSPFASWLLSTLGLAQRTADDWRPRRAHPVARVAAGAPRRRARRRGARLGAPGAQRTRDMSLGAALRSPPFIVLGLTFFACCAMHSGPIFHTISYAIFCGVPPMAAVSIYSLEGLAGLGGRLLFGVLGDRYGAKRVLVAGLLVQALAAGAFVFATRLGDFYAVSFVFGLAYGGVMPLYAVLARGYFGPHIMGGVIRRCDPGVEPRHGARAAGRRLDLRLASASYALALRRFVRRRPGRGGDRARLPAAATARPGRGRGLARH